MILRYSIGGSAALNKAVSYTHLLVFRIGQHIASNVPSIHNDAFFLSHLPLKLNQLFTYIGQSGTLGGFLRDLGCTNLIVDDRSVQYDISPGKIDAGLIQHRFQRLLILGVNPADDGLISDGPVHGACINIIDTQFFCHRFGNRTFTGTAGTCLLYTSRCV